jgi:hypothetical protein
MPLFKSKGKAASAKNVKTEKTAGKPLKQALVTSLSMQRQAKAKRKKPRTAYA